MFSLVAQWIEQLPAKEKVTGSNPVLKILFNFIYTNARIEILPRICFKGSYSTNLIP